MLVTGGMLRLSAMSLVGDLGADVLRTTRINKGFLGARGLSLERGLMDLNPDEVRIKQEMADACEQVYGILDGTKWHRSALLSFVAVDDLTGIVTDSSAPADEVEAWRAAGVEVITVEPGPREPPPVRPRDLRRAVRNDAGGGLMAAMAAVDLGAQSGRVAVGRFDGERSPSPRCTASPNEPVRLGGRRCAGTSTALRRDVLDGLRAAARDSRRSTRSASTRGPSTSAWSTRRAGSLENPVHYRDARRAAASTDVLARVPARELYERTGIQILPINTIFELAAMAAEHDPALAAAETLLLIPDLVHHWLCGSRATEFTNATTTQCLDAATGDWAADLLERLDVPTRALPGGRRSRARCSGR